MSHSFDDLIRRLDERPEDFPQPSAEALDAYEFLANPQASLDDVPDAVLEKWFTAVGGVARFVSLRTRGPLDHALAVVKQTLRDHHAERRRLDVARDQAAYLAAVRDALGLPVDQPPTTAERLDCLEALTTAHQQLVRELALDRRAARIVAAVDSPSAQVSTVRASDRTSTELAEVEPEWALNREIVLDEEVAPSDPLGALVFRWNEFGGESPEQIAALLRASGKLPEATSDSVARTIHQIRIYTYDQAAT